MLYYNYAIKRSILLSDFVHQVRIVRHLQRVTHQALFTRAIWSMLAAIKKKARTEMTFMRRQKKFSESPFHLQPSWDSSKPPEETPSAQCEVENLLHVGCHVGEKQSTLWINPSTSLSLSSSLRVDPSHPNTHLLLGHYSLAHPTSKHQGWSVLPLCFRFLTVNTFTSLALFSNHTAWTTSSQH